MPQNHPEFWLARVENRLRVGDSAPFLTGIEEVAADITVLNGGSANEINQIHLPMSEFDVDVLIDNSEYPIPVQNYEDGTITLNLNKYQTKQVPLSDDQVIGASYDIIDNATKGMVKSLLIKKYKRAIWNIAPANDSADMPVLKATGRSGKLDVNGDMIIWKDGNRLRLTHLDIVDHKKQYDDLEVPEDNRRLVLCSDHYNDLLYDRDRYADMLKNINTGTLASQIAGFYIYSYLKMPVYDGQVKQAFDTIPAEGQYKASVSFYADNIGIKTGMTRQYYKPSAIDTDNQSNTVAYRHYYLCSRKQAAYCGAIVSVDAVV